MIQRKTGICSKCGFEGVFGNVGRRLCTRCNQERLNALKPPKKAPVTTQKPLKKSTFKYRRKATGEKDLFVEIWEEREHICEHCGIPIQEPTASNFAHIKAKSVRPDLRLDKTNIALYCRDCHDAYDCRGIDKFNARKNLYR